MLINQKEISNDLLNEIFERDAEKMRIGLNYNYYKLIDAIIKTRKDFDIKSLLEKTDQELEQEKIKIELPSLDRSLKENLKFKMGKNTIPKDFKNLIKIDL